LRYKSKHKIIYHYIDGIEECDYVPSDQNRILHRDCLPAIIHKGLGPTEYFYNGKNHNMNGPAIVYKQSKRLDEWYYHGLRINVTNQEDFMKEIKKLIFS